MSAVVCVILAIVLAAMSALLFWWSGASGTDGALVGPAGALALLAVLSALIAVLGFQVAARESGALPLTGPLQLFTILTVAIGLSGAVLGIALGAATGSVGAIGSGVAAFFAAFPVAVQGALLHGTAKHRA